MSVQNNRHRQEHESVTQEGTTADTTSSVRKKSTTRSPLLQDFSLSTLEGRKVQISSFRGRSNLVLIFIGKQIGKRERNYVNEITAHTSDLITEEARVFVILRSHEDARSFHDANPVPLTLLIDEDGQAHRAVGAIETDGNPAPMVIVTDRYGEIFASYSTTSGEELPDSSEIIKWLFFINSQCPECGVPEWPQLEELG